MNDQELYYRYALALALVPDANVAGDLFMAARSDADLRRRAMRWLRRQALPVPGPEVAVAGLDAAQREYALHLARRGRRRRRGTAMLAGLLTVLLAAGVVGLAPRVSVPTGLGAESAFRGQAVAQMDSPDGLTFTVHEADVQIGKVTLWWSVEGKGAATLADTIQPLLCGGLGLPGGPVEPVARETAAPRRDRLLGRTVYRTRQVQAQTCHLAVSKAPGQPQSWSPTLFLVPGENPANLRSVPVHLSHMDPRGVVNLHTVSAGDGFVVVDYEAEGPEDLLFAAHTVEVRAEGLPLERWGYLGIWGRYPYPRRQQMVFGPLPAGSESLEVVFPGLPHANWRQEEISLPAPGTVTDWNRTANTIIASLLVPGELAPAGLTASLVDRAGRVYPLKVYNSEREPLERVILYGRVVPPDSDLTLLRLEGWERQPGGTSFVVDLRNGREK